MARKFHEFKLQRRVWAAWAGVAHAAARAKFEARVKEETRVKIETMEKECDARMLTLQAALKSARAEIETLRNDRETHEERVKAALMRGVCALNVETMSVLSGAGGGNGGSAAPSVRSCGSVDGSLNASSIHATHNGSTNSTARGEGKGGGGAFVGLGNLSDLNGGKSEDNFCSTPDVSPSISSHRFPQKTSIDAVDSNFSLRSSHPSSYQQQRPSSRSLYQPSASRRSCGIHPIGNAGKEKGAQIKTIPHNTIVIERHVDRT